MKYRRRQLRKSQTEAENILWQEIRNKNLGFRFVRQFSVRGYVMDFYCPKARLAIELEGKIHKKPDVKKYDKYRTSYLEAFGIKVLRINNEEIINNLKLVSNRICFAASKLTPSPELKLSKLSKLTPNPSLESREGNQRGEF
jgi:very-short-patch-repair endonuclease